MARLPEDRRKAFTDAYRFYEEHWDMENRTENWQKAAEQLGIISTENGDSRLVRNLLLALYQTIEQDAKDATSI